MLESFYLDMSKFRGDVFAFVYQLFEQSMGSLKSITIGHFQMYMQP
jgi:hypothetical protein